jgi:hypothetical protein
LIAQEVGIFDGFVAGPWLRSSSMISIFQTGEQEFRYFLFFEFWSRIGQSMMRKSHLCQSAILFVFINLIATSALKGDTSSSESESKVSQKTQKVSGIKAVRKYLEDRGIEIQDIPKAILIYEGLSMCFM